MKLGIAASLWGCLGFAWTWNLWNLIELATILTTREREPQKIIGRKMVWIAIKRSNSRRVLNIYAIAHSYRVIYTLKFLLLYYCILGHNQIGPRNCIFTKFFRPFWFGNICIWKDYNGGTKGDRGEEMEGWGWRDVQSWGRCTIVLLIFLYFNSQVHAGLFKVEGGVL